MIKSIEEKVFWWESLLMRKSNDEKVDWWECQLMNWSIRIILTLNWKELVLYELAGLWLSISVTTIDDYWQLLMTIDDYWWLLMTTYDYWPQTDNASC